MIKLYIVFLLLTASACASKKEETVKHKPKAKSTKEILENFHVDKKVIQKFEEKVEVQAITSQAPANASATITNAPKKADPIIPLQKIPQTVHKAPIIKTQIEKETPVKTAKDKKKEKPYPAEFTDADKYTLKYWGQLKPNIKQGEKIYMDMTYLGMKTGTIILENKPNTVIGNEPVYHFSASLESAPFYRYVYELDDKIDSYIAIKDFSPRKFKFVQRESAQSVDDLQLFDNDKHQVMWFYERETKKNKEKKNKTRQIPLRYQDPLSVINFIRSLPLNKGDKYTIPVINKSKLLTLEVEPEEYESLETAIGKLETVRVHVLTQYTGDNLKSGDMMFWFTRDSRKIFVKVKAKIKIGAVNGEITKYSH